MHIESGDNAMNNDGMHVTYLNIAYSMETDGHVTEGAATDIFGSELAQRDSLEPFSVTWRRD